MGAKITVDSAGMINKGLEVIEAIQLFDLTVEDTAVLIHPQSHVHALLHLCNGACLMHASPPDMTLPIAHVLHYPESADLPIQLDPKIAGKVTTETGGKVDAEAGLGIWPALEFQEVDRNKYPGFFLALECARQGGSAPAIFNAVNEMAVEAFLAERIPFFRIAEVIARVIDKTWEKSRQPNFADTTATSACTSFETAVSPYMEADQMARVYAKECLEKGDFSEILTGS